GWSPTARATAPGNASGSRWLNEAVHLALSLAVLAVTVVLVSGLCRRFDLPTPLVLVALGAGASFVPLVPEVHLTSEVVLIGMPRRLVTILEGESLLNDATALVALRTAIASSAVVTVWGVGLDFLVAAAGGVLAGLVVYVVVAWVRRRVSDPVLDTSISLVTP